MAIDSTQLFLKILGLLAVLCGGVVAIPAQADADSCRDAIRPLEAKRDSVADREGLWTLFEKSTALRPHSRLGLQLDSSVNQLIGYLVYLCETRKGVPLTELAEYVLRKVSLQGEDGFKKKMKILGKPAKEVELWIEYSRIAVRNQDRNLELKTIRSSIAAGKKWLDAYARRADSIAGSDDHAHLHGEFLKLKQGIDRFFASDPNVSLAILENSQVPFWDIDENYGGS